MNIPLVGAIEHAGVVYNFDPPVPVHPGAPVETLGDLALAYQFHSEPAMYEDAGDALREAAEQLDELYESIALEALLHGKDPSRILASQLSEQFSCAVTYTQA